jgi:glycosyltransferase involved in cell wall biosynthesis
MRVLFLTHAYPRYEDDAAGSFLHRLAVALRASGCDIRVLAPSGEGLVREESIDGVPVRRFRYAPRGMESLAYTGTMAEQVLGSLRGKAALAGFITAGGFAVNRAIKRLAPDVVHAHWWFPAGLLALAGEDVPLVTTLHGSDVRLARKVAWVHPLLRKVLARSSAVTSVSGWLAGEARAMAPAARISVAPMPADVARFRDLDTPRIPGRFVFVGRLNKQKGLGELLEALAWTPPSVSLDVVGEGEDASALRALAERLGVAGRVHWRGQLPRSEIADAYRRAQGLVIPSREEGLGLVAVEAQLVRTPVIAYRSGGLPDVVSPEWGGTLVPAGDTRALAEAMRGLIADPEAAAEHGASARALMLDRFSPGAVAATYLELYRGVLTGD